MEEWKKYRIGDLCDISSSKRIFAEEYRTVGIPFYRGKEIIEKHNGNTPSTEIFIDPDRYNSIKDKYGVPKQGDILLTSVGTLGIPYIVKNESFYFKDGNLTWFRNFKGILSEYLYYWFHSKQAQAQIDGKCIGSTQKALPIEVLKNFEITIPSIYTQNRIVSILRSIDGKINLNNRINHNLEQQAQALYKSWFVDFEPFKDDMFVDSELGMIPEGWKVAPLDSLCSIISRGFSPKYNDESDDLDLGQRCVRNNLIDLSIARRHIPKNLGERELKKWDILINSTGFGSLGRVAQIYFTPNHLTFDSHLTLVRSKEEFSKQYIGRNLLSRQDEIENLAVGSTGQTELPRERVKALPIIVPTHDVMSSFGEKIKALNELIQRNIEANLILQKERDELLPRLMSGSCQLANNAI